MSEIECRLRKQRESLEYDHDDERDGVDVGFHYRSANIQSLLGGRLLRDAGSVAKQNLTMQSA